MEAFGDQFLAGPTLPDDQDRPSHRRGAAGPLPRIEKREARSRQTAIAARLESAENRVKLRTLMSTERTDEALARFDQLERRVDYAEGRADALSIADDGDRNSLADEIAALEGSDAIDDELAQMKKALGKPEDAGNKEG